ERPVVGLDHDWPDQMVRQVECYFDLTTPNWNVMHNFGVIAWFSPANGEARLASPSRTIDERLRSSVLHQRRQVDRIDDTVGSIPGYAVIACHCPHRASLLEHAVVPRAQVDGLFKATGPATLSHGTL